MKLLERTTTLLAVTFFMAATVLGQEPTLLEPSAKFDVLKADVGTWDVEIKTWNESGEATVSKGSETNRMLGGFWLLADFQGCMMGIDFQGHGVYTYDAEKKRYTGTWIDSMGPSKMDMVGKHDQAAKTMTYEGIGPAPDGKPAKHIMTTQYKDDGTRVMIMHMQAGDQMIKIFEMNYTKAENADDLESKTEH